ncbi:MAG: RNA methyltransferase [Marinilabiliales bacterium]|nr:MAG: RNA methyltransferase [Marinilabiliales bacterium]
MFVIEGIREIRLAMNAGYQFHTLFYCPSVAGNGAGVSLPGEMIPGETITEKTRSGCSGRFEETADIVDTLTGQARIIETSAPVFSRLAYRGASGGLLAVARQKKLLVEELVPGDDPLVLVAESVEKPGNLGAMLRTADAAGVDAVLVCDSATDIYNPNVVRSSLGTLFTVPVACCTSAEAIGWLKARNIRIFTTALNASVPYHQARFAGPCAIVAGAEATGVSPAWEENSDANIIIPMYGKVDSINVSAAVSIVIYEALRQRGFKAKGKI